MRYVDESGADIDESAIDLTKGHVEVETVVLEHHDERPYQDAVTHTETMSNGLEITRVDTEAVPYRPAYDDVELVGTYIPYTDAELADIKAKQEQDALEAQKDEQMKDAITILLANSVSTMTSDDATAVSAFWPQYDPMASYSQYDIVRYENGLYQRQADANVILQSELPPDESPMWKRFDTASDQS